MEDKIFYYLNHLLDSDLFREAFTRNAVTKDKEIKYFKEVESISREIIEAIKEDQIPYVSINYNKQND